MTRILPALALVVLLAACDTAVDTPDTADATADTETAAVAIASAISLDTGGALDDAAGAAFATAGVPASGPQPGHPGCDAERSYDETAVLWTLVLDCERGRPDGMFYATLARTATLQFTAAGTPQQLPQGADALAYRLLSGTALRRSPHGTHRVTSSSASVDVTDLADSLVTVNGTFARAGTDSLSVRGRTRTAVYTLDLTATDIRGPRVRRQHWNGAVSGTLSGVYRATVTASRRDGTTVTRNVERTFTVTFPGGGEAEIALGGRRFRASAQTGEIETLL